MEGSDETNYLRRGGAIVSGHGTNQLCPKNDLVSIAMENVNQYFIKSNVSPADIDIVN